MTAGTIGSGRAPQLRHTHFELAAEALTRVIARDAADLTLRELFAAHRSAGSRDRAAITTLVYGVLRDYFPLRAALGPQAGALELCSAHALRALAVSAEALPRLE